MKRWLGEMDDVLSNLTLAFLQLERSGKCCHGLTLSQCHTLDLLSKQGGLSMNELSRQMGLAKSTMTRIVDKMVREGWIDRSRDSGDCRLVTVRLTRKGVEIAKTLSHSSRDYVQRILKHLPPEKIPQVMEALKLIIRSVEKEVRKESKR
jgi:MarR family transcriptional regulator, organic hydroperoxide resistance regulator